MACDCTDANDGRDELSVIDDDANEVHVVEEACVAMDVRVDEAAGICVRVVWVEAESIDGERGLGEANTSSICGGCWDACG